MNYLQKSTLILLTAVTPFLGIVTRVYAEDIVISGNGNESASAVSSSQDTAAAVNQNNTTTIENNVAVDANTGNNTASDNSGDVQISTGDVAITDVITNTANSSVVHQDTCCGGQGQISISGNGSGSTNNTSYHNASNTSITVNNNAAVNNTVRGYVSTGYNTANDNSGNISINTGDISVKEKITTNANVSFISVTSPLNKDYILNILGNGSNSTNTITDSNTNDIVIAVNNNAHIFNNSFWDLVTGNNTANGNSGDVTIATGDIDFESLISNNVNVSEVIVTCCKDDKPEPIVPPENPVQPKTDNNSVQGASASSSGSSNGSSGPSLPSTGNMWFFLALFGNLAALIYGTYLRLRSGRSPAYALA